MNGVIRGKIAPSAKIMPGAFPRKMMAMINLDTVGRLEGRKLVVFGVESAKEFTHLIMGCGFRLTLAGLAVGLVGAIGLSRYLTSLLFEVSPLDLPGERAVSRTLL